MGKSTAVSMRENEHLAPSAPSPARGSVCFITQAKAFGGVEVHTLGLMQALIERGYHIEMIACRHEMYDAPVRERGWQSSVTLIKSPLEVGFSHEISGIPAEWNTLLASVRSDILIFPKAGNSQGSLSFMRACRRHFRKVYLIEHLEDPLPKRFSHHRFGFGFWWYRHKLLKKLRPVFADHIVAVSEKVKERLTEDWGNSPRKITVIRNGVAWRTLGRNEALGATFRKEHDIPQDAFVFGMVARLREEKGIDIALRAMQALLQSGTPRKPYLIIAGRGPDEALLKSLASELGLGDAVRFLGFQSDVGRILSGFDSIVFSSRLEGLPIGLLEGMAAGCIPIVTRISGMPEAVDGPDIGWVVPPEDPHALTEAMRDALSLDETSRARRRVAVTQRIREQFDLDTAHERFLQTFGL
jgi:glycosyltransferase involved in cell wall biosynthesis